MKRERSYPRHDRLRLEIARVAAQLLYDEEARSYRDARRQALRRCSPGASDQRGTHLPDYPEIHAAFAERLLFYGGAALAERVRRYRRLALEYLELLAEFHPLLVGSVARGEVREISDINLQLFCDKPEEVGYFLERAGIPFEEEGDAAEARYYFVAEGIEIECAVCPEVERRQVPHCRITGAAQERLGFQLLKELLAAQPE